MRGACRSWVCVWWASPKIIQKRRVSQRRQDCNSCRRRSGETRAPVHGAGNLNYSSLVYLCVRSKGTSKGRMGSGCHRVDDVLPLLASDRALQGRGAIVCPCAAAARSRCSCRRILASLIERKPGLQTANRCRQHRISDAQWRGSLLKHRAPFKIKSGTPNSPSAAPNSRLTTSNSELAPSNMECMSSISELAPLNSALAPPNSQRESTKKVNWRGALRLWPRSSLKLDRANHSTDFP